MYTEFYNLQEKPFDLTHSSRFLYLGEVHKEALSMLTYGVMERKGFVLLTGEVGTGKTTILQAMLKDLDKDVKYVHLANPLLSPKEFMNYITLSAFRNRISFKSKAEFLVAFEAFLTRCAQHQKHFLLVIDEAHKLSYDLLEEVRLLSNMETADEKLISIFFVGQPELNKKLSDPRCRALLQRISIRYNIKPLSLRETEEYIAKRLRVAGAKRAEDIFPKAVQRAIYECSGGFPRMINILSDNLLLLGYARGQRKLTAGMARECYQDMQLPDSTSASTTPEPETKIAATKAETRPSPDRNGLWKWAMVALLVILLGAAGYYFRDEIRSTVTKLVDRYTKPASALQTERRARADEEKPPDMAKTAAPPTTGEAQKKTEASATSPISHPSPSASPSPLDGEGVVVNPSPSMGEVYTPLAAPKATRGEDGGVPGGDSGQTVIVQDGDTLDKLAKRIYGRSDEKIWEMIQKSNSGIRNVDFIRPGQQLVFPPLPEERSAVSGQRSVRSLD